MDAKFKDRRQVRFTGAETRRRDQGQKAGQVQGDRSRAERWRVVNDAMTMWQRVSDEELVKRRLGDRDDPEQVSSVISLVFSCGK